MTRKFGAQLLAVAITVLGLVMLVASLESERQASADPSPPVEVGCLVFGVDPEDCPNGALIVHDSCGVFSTAIPESPSSKLATYEDYLDLPAIYSSGIDIDGDGLGELLSGVNAPGGIKLVITPGGQLNIQCWFDVSEYLLDDSPKRALVTEFLCGPPGDIDRRGTSRLTSSGNLRINCHIGDFGS